MPINQRNAGFISATYQPLQVANAPTIGAATAGDASASVAFTAPANVGGSAISAYYAVSNPDRVTVSGASSPINVTGLTNGTSYTFSVWALNTYGPSPFSGASGSATPQATIGVFGGGTTGSSVNVIDSLSLSSAGNATDFGDLVADRQQLAACSSKTRGLFGGGVHTNAITYITIASQGDSASFGNLTSAAVSGRPASLSSSTRGIWAGGYDALSIGGRLNVIDYVTIATTGNATDFGDLTSETAGALDETYGTASPTRGLICGGSSDSQAINVIQYITIASTGNSTSFGNLSTVNVNLSAASSNTRAVIAGGTNNVTTFNAISYVTIATTGGAAGFGDLTVARRGLAACSSSINAIFGGGTDAGSTIVNVIDKVTIATTGNATDFGDLTVARTLLSACSSGHGGL